MKGSRILEKRRELIFVITVYPAMVILFIYIKKLLIGWVESNPIYYGLITLICSVIIVAFVLIEIITKVYNYEIQGEKLKIRQREGINIEDINNGR